MAVDKRHPQFTEYSDAWENAAARSHSEPKRLAYDDYRAADAAKMAESGLFAQAIKTLNEIGNTEYKDKHKGHLENIRRFPPPQPCGPHHALVGGGCLNCGWHP